MGRIWIAGVMPQQAFCCIACRRSTGKWALYPLPPSHSLGTPGPPFPLAHGQIRTGSLEKANCSGGAKGWLGNKLLSASTSINVTKKAWIPGAGSAQCNQDSYSDEVNARTNEVLKGCLGWFFFREGAYKSEIEYSMRINQAADPCHLLAGADYKGWGWPCKQSFKVRTGLLQLFERPRTLGRGETEIQTHLDSRLIIIIALGNLEKNSYSTQYALLQNELCNIDSHTEKTNSSFNHQDCSKREGLEMWK